MKKKGVLVFATTWMKLEYIILSEINQTDNDEYCVVSLICGILKKKNLKAHFMKTESRIVVARGWRSKGTNLQV